jgi:hypothetical protein
MTDIIQRCSYCNSIKDQYGYYNPRIKIPHEMNEIAKPLSISDGVCEKCYDKIKLTYQQKKSDSNSCVTLPPERKLQ